MVRVVYVVILIYEYITLFDMPIIIMKSENALYIYCMHFRIIYTFSYVCTVYMYVKNGEFCDCMRVCI